MDGQDGGDAERERLLRVYEAMPKTEHWLMDSSIKHSEVRPEWIAAIVEDPYEVVPESNRRQSTIVLSGRVRQFGQWIRVVLERTDGDLALHTAYPDRRLELRYGRRPWR